MTQYKKGHILSDHPAPPDEPVAGGKDQRAHIRKPLSGKLRLLTRKEQSQGEDVPTLKIEANCIDISASGIGASCKECSLTIGEMVEIRLGEKKQYKAICSVTHIDYDENFTYPYQIGLRFQKLNKDFVDFLKDVVKAGA